MRQPRRTLLSPWLAAVLLLIAVKATANDPLPFRSAEHMVYRSVASVPALGLLKADGFEGVIERSDAEDSAVRLLDLYALPDEGRLKMDATACAAHARRLAGVRGTTQVMARPQMFESRFGHACFVLIMDQDPTALIQQRAFAVGLVKGKPYAIGARFERAAAENTFLDLKDFFKSLK